MLRLLPVFPRASRHLAVTLFVALPWAGAAQEKSGPATPLELVAGLSIGCASCGGPERFAAIEDLAVDEEGRIYVADREGPHVRVFDAAGEALFTALREGEGPGEARSIHGLALLTEGRLAALDYLARRITVLDGSGSLVETHRLDGFPQGIYGAPDRSGFWTIETNFRAPETFAFWSSGTMTPTEVAPALDGTGLEHADPGFRFYAATSGPGGRLALGDGEIAYRIRVVGTDGTRRYDVGRDIPRVPKSAGEVEAERAERAAGIRRLTAREGADHPEGAAASPQVEVDPLHRHFLMDDLEFDPRGRLWVRTPRGVAGRTVFDLFSEDGRYLGEVEVEGRVSRFAVGRDRLVAAALDDLDVPSVRVWGIRTP